MSFPQKTTPVDLPANLKFENTSFAAQAKMNTYNKPAIFVQNNNNNQTVQKSRPRGGWDDGEDEPTLNVNTNAKPISQQNSFNQIKSSPVSVGTNDSTPTIDEFVATKKSEIKECDEEFFNKNEYESKIVMELIQPGGARLKPTDAVLNEFCRACETLQTQVIGSLLFHNLEASIAWQSKIKTLYAIEALVKKVKKYNEYFKSNVIVLKAKQFPNDGANSAQLKKILGDVANAIDGVSNAPQVKLQQNNEIAASPKFVQEIDPLDESQGWQNPIKNESSPVRNNVPLKVNTTPSWGNANPTTNPINNVQPVKQEVKSAQQPQAKFNPFGIAPSTNTVNSANPTKPSSGGLPGAFKNKTLNANNASPSITKSTSSISSHDETKISKQPSITSSTLPQPTSGSQSITDQGLINSLSGLDFGGEQGSTPTNKLNDLYSMYPQQQPNFNGNFGGPMPYPQQFHDPNMMGPGQFPQPYYPGPQFQPMYNGPGPYNNGFQQFPPQGQFPPEGQFNGYPNYPPPQMQQGGFPGYQGGHPGQMMYPPQEGFQNQQHQNQNQNQNQQQQQENGEEEELSKPTQAEIASRQEQERKKQEEMVQMKKQQEIENKFDSLKFLI